MSSNLQAHSDLEAGGAAVQLHPNNSNQIEEPFTSVVVGGKVEHAHYQQSSAPAPRHSPHPIRMMDASEIASQKSAFSLDPSTDESTSSAIRLTTGRSRDSFMSADVNSFNNFSRQDSENSLTIQEPFTPTPSLLQQQSMRKQSAPLLTINEKNELLYTQIMDDLRLNQKAPPALETQKSFSHSTSTSSSSLSSQESDAPKHPSTPPPSPPEPVAEGDRRFTSADLSQIEESHFTTSQNNDNAPPEPSEPKVRFEIGESEPEDPPEPSAIGESRFVTEEEPQIDDPPEPSAIGEAAFEAPRAIEDPPEPSAVGESKFEVVEETPRADDPPEPSEPGESHFSPSDYPPEPDSDTTSTSSDESTRPADSPPEPAAPGQSRFEAPTPLRIITPPPPPIPEPTPSGEQPKFSLGAWETAKPANGVDNSLLVDSQEMNQAKFANVRNKLASVLRFNSVKSFDLPPTPPPASP